MTSRTLVLIRHAKSDWSVEADDLGRPLSLRGRSQAPEIGKWLTSHLPPLEVAIVSPAARARQTWDLAAAQMHVAPAPPHVVEDGVYTFDGDALFDLVRELPDGYRRVAIVGHNPALEEVVHRMTGHHVVLRTATLVALEQGGSWVDAGTRLGRVRGHGRPATEHVAIH